MITIVDTSVWSQALRRPKKQSATNQAGRVLRAMVSDGQSVALPGIVLQELLSGVRVRREFERLREVLSPFQVIYAREEHHVEAARIFNACRKKGIATTAPDALIAATTRVEHGQLLTSDNDFNHMAEIVDLKVNLIDPSK